MKLTLNHVARLDEADAGVQKQILHEGRRPPIQHGKDRLLWGRCQHRRLRVSPDPPLARGALDTIPVELESDKPAAATVRVQRITPSFGASSGHLTWRGQDQEATNGDPDLPTHPTDRYCGPPHL